MKTHFLIKYMYNSIVIKHFYVSLVLRLVPNLVSYLVTSREIRPLAVSYTPPLKNVLSVVARGGILMQMAVTSLSIVSVFKEIYGGVV